VVRQCRHERPSITRHGLQSAGGVTCYVRVESGDEGASSFSFVEGIGSDDPSRFEVHRILGQKAEVASEVARLWSDAESVSVQSRYPSDRRRVLLGCDECWSWLAARHEKSRIAALFGINNAEGIRSIETEVESLVTPARQPQRCKCLHGAPCICDIRDVSTVLGSTARRSVPPQRPTTPHSGISQH